MEHNHNQGIWDLSNAIRVTRPRAFDYAEGFDFLSIYTLMLMVELTCWMSQAMTQYFPPPECPDCRRPTWLAASLPAQGVLPAVAAFNCDHCNKEITIEIEQASPPLFDWRV
jgi:hypothetical protein